MSNIFNALNLQELFVVILLTIVPSLILLMLILYSDRKSREPLFMILICVFSGAFTICLSLLIDKIILKSNIISNDLFVNGNTFNLQRIVILACVEEYSKLFVLYLFLYKNKSYDDIYDGFVYSSIIALSFSLVETFIYVFSELSYKDMTMLAILRNLTSIPLHIVCGIVMGYFVSLEKFSKNHSKKVLNMFLALIVPTLIHSIYNTFFSLVTFASNSYSIILITILFVLSIYFIGIMFIMKINNLNKIFINNGYYPKQYRFLMKKSESVYFKNRSLI